MASFELPITSISENSSKILNKEVVDDLELLSSCKKILCPSTEFGEKTVCLWTTNYTSEVAHLKDTQILLSKSLPTMSNSHMKEIKKIYGVWNQIVSMNTDINAKDQDKNEENNNDDLGFHTKYQYIDWKMLRPLNNNSQFLQLMSIYNMTTPVLSLCLPIFFFILPFFILRFQGSNITFTKYFEILKVVFRKHQIGQLFSISSATWDKRIYIIVSMVFYVLQIYQNVRSCISFTRNMKHIHEQLFIIRNHINDTLNYMYTYEAQTKDLKSYENFVANMKLHRHILLLAKRHLESISEITLSISKTKEIGHVMKCFYQLYNSHELKASLDYSFSFCGYIDNLNGLKKAIHKGLLGKCKFSKNRTKFKNAFYPVTETEPVKNTYDIGRHHLITGPNAAGKTTLLKATMFNIILSQQIGYGCYDNASIVPFDYIHCYINIPDTSGRDSLFQAEARRCKDILEIIKTSSPETRHFCVFDELYSGTNPYEAIGSAAAYLTYLNKQPNVSFMLTTHFLGLCHKLKRQRRFLNCHMSVERNGEDFHYTYKLTKGISDVKGGVKVLKDLEYPDEIVRETKKVISKITF
jgi:energy-coupling factor transporter ATP-binding protein EcfA2